MVTFIRVAFSGKAFYGSQKQPNKRTVQGVFEELLSKIYNSKIKVTISSRLDRGVNALDFAISYPTPKDTRITPSHLEYYINRATDSDIVIKEVREIDSETFSCRYDCAYKRYLYMIQNTKKPNPLFESFTYSPKIHLLDEKKIRDALSLFEGEHDFRSFASPEGDENTILTIRSCFLDVKNDIFYLRFEGRNFLRYQVRFMVGAILSYNDGKITLEKIKKLLNGENINFIKYKAEPQGLLLEKILYPQFDSEEELDTFSL